MKYYVEMYITKSEAAIYCDAPWPVFGKEPFSPSNASLKLQGFSTECHSNACELPYEGKTVLSLDVDFRTAVHKLT